MATAAQWLSGARFRTLPAAISPVLVGTGAAAALDAFSPGRALLALGVALALQVGVNYANDYSDGIRGTDDDRGAGPFRLTGSGLAAPARVKAAAFGCFALACLLGLVLVAWSGTWWLIAVGALAVLAAWGYTGGTRPYGYRGLGEVGVFVFFGLVAVLGTTYTQALTISWPAVWGAIAVGLWACAVLVANNQRDIVTDAAAGKRTLSVRLGDRGSRWLYVTLLAVPFAALTLIAIGIPSGPSRPWTALAFVAAAPAAIAGTRMLRGAQGRDLVALLKLTGLTELLYAAALGLGLALS